MTPKTALRTAALLALLFGCCLVCAIPPHSPLRHLLKPTQCKPSDRPPTATPAPPTSPPLPLPHDFLEALVETADNLISDREASRLALRRFRLAGLLGHSGALATAAALLLVGDGEIQRDVPAAIRHLRQAAAASQADAHALLGALHASGIADRHGIVKSPSKALAYWKKAAASNNVYASTALGFRYMHGIGVPKSCQRAARYYKRAARSIATDARYWPSALNFVNGKPPLPTGLMETPPTRLDENSLSGEKTDSADHDLVHFFRHSAERGDPMSRTTLGALHYFGGHGIDPDEPEARLHLERAAAANENNEEAHAMLGHLDMRSRKNESANLHFRHAVGKDNNPLAHYALGMAYKHGLLNFKQSYSTAKMHFRLALDNGSKHGGAMFELGLMHWYGQGVEQDINRAFNYFESGALHGNIQSKLNVGTILVDGSLPIGKVYCERGVQLLKEVAEDGEWQTVLELAVEKVEDGDYYGALYRYLEAAHAGIELAQYNAAFLLEKLSAGKIGEVEHWERARMLKEAEELYELSANQGHTNALIRSANAVYLELQDYTEAARIFKKAAELNNAEGMVSLGLMHAQGLGVAQSRQQATFYLNWASDVDKEAIAPAKVALVGLQLYWWAHDVANLLRGIAGWAETWMVTLPRGVGSQGSVKRLSTDVALVSALMVALVTVLVVRTKRLARR